eukprot:913382_1
MGYAQVTIQPLVMTRSSIVQFKDHLSHILIQPLSLPPTSYRQWMTIHVNPPPFATGYKVPVPIVYIFTQRKRSLVHFTTKTPINACVVTIPVTINQTISCCDETTMDCETIFDDIEQGDANCASNTQLSTILDTLWDAYVTSDFSRFIACNKSDYNQTCPSYIWNDHHSDYAKAGCLATDSVVGANTYFPQLTNIIEKTLSSFGYTDWQQYCPAWGIACEFNNGASEATLDIYEILCPIDFGSIAMIAPLEEQVKIGTSAHFDTQIEIYTECDILRVVMYSEEDANQALSFVQSGSMESLGSGTECELVKGSMNYNVGDTFSCPTDNPTGPPTMVPTVALTTTEESTTIVAETTGTQQLPRDNEDKANLIKKVHFSIVCLCASMLIIHY